MPLIAYLAGSHGFESLIIIAVAETFSSIVVVAQTINVRA
jgi:hypothetical protein